jgi:hypothetical protein
MKDEWFLPDSKVCMAVWIFREAVRVEGKRMK